MLWFYVNVCKQNKFINIVLVNKTFIDSNLDKLVHDVFRQRVLWILPTVRTDNFLGQSLEQNPTKNTLTYQINVVLLGGYIFKFSPGTSCSTKYPSVTIQVKDAKQCFTMMFIMPSSLRELETALAINKNAILM